jgi:transposase
MKPQQQYVGLDLSLEQTSVCVVDDAWRDLARQVQLEPTNHSCHGCEACARVGLKTGQLSTWLFHELKARQLPVICIDAHHAKAALSLQINKIDTNDAHEIAQIVWRGGIGTSLSPSG